MQTFLALRYFINEIAKKWNFETLLSSKYDRKAFGKCR